MEGGSRPAVVASLAGHAHKALSTKRIHRGSMNADHGEIVCYMPSALAGTKFEIGRFSGEPNVFKEWDGLPFELP